MPCQRPCVLLNDCKIITYYFMFSALSRHRTQFLIIFDTIPRQKTGFFRNTRMRNTSSRQKITRSHHKSISKVLNYLNELIIKYHVYPDNFFNEHLLNINPVSAKSSTKSEIVNLRTIFCRSFVVLFLSNDQRKNEE